MPVYEYACKACEHEFELFHSMKDAPKKKCPECGKLKLKRLIGTGAGVIFKGSGFYETDYRSDSYKKAAEAGDRLAQRNLGLMYEEGEGVERDYERAAQWYRRAAAQGDPVAQNKLGRLYSYGFGVPHDYRRAAYWARKAAENGNAEAQYALQSMLVQGLGTSSDSVSAYTWALYSARQGYPGGEQAWENRGQFLSREEEKRVRALVEKGKWPPYPRFSAEEAGEMRRRGQGEVRRLH